MAGDGRQSQPGLGAPQPEDMDFFALLRQLETASGARFGRGARPDEEPARLGQDVRLSFATRDVLAMRPATDDRPAEVRVAVFGLTGPEGPLPLHLTRWLFERLGQRWYAGDRDAATRDTSFLDLLNLVQHRMIGFFYRAWADNRPEVHAGRPGGGWLGAMLRALAGPGPEPLDRVRLGQTTALAHQVRGPERLADLLAAATGAPIRITEFVGAWSTIPARHQTRLGRAHSGLGRGATLGPRIFGRQNRIEVRVGPVPLADYDAFMPGGERLAALRLAVLDALGDTLDVDMRLILAGDARPQPRIGIVRLGRTSWIGRPEPRDADDFRLQALVGLATEGPKAAA